FFQAEDGIRDLYVTGVQTCALPISCHQQLPECKARLASIQSYRRQFLMVTRATVTSSKTVDFSFRGPLGFEAHTVLLSVDGDSRSEERRVGKECRSGCARCNKKKNT